MIRRAPMQRSSIKPSQKPLARSPMARSKPMKASYKPMKSKQLAVTVQEKLYWSRLAELGCIACLLDGNRNTHVSIHHIYGRTKPGCHSLALPLCAPHHQQDDTDPMGRVAVHPNSARFEKKYGSEMELKQRCDAYLNLA